MCFERTSLDGCCYDMLNAVLIQGRYSLKTNDIYESVATSNH